MLAVPHVRVCVCVCAPAEPETAPVVGARPIRRIKTPTTRVSPSAIKNRIFVIVLSCCCWRSGCCCDFVSVCVCVCAIVIVCLGGWRMCAWACVCVCVLCVHVQWNHLVVECCLAETFFFFFLWENGLILFIQSTGHRLLAHFDKHFWANCGFVFCCEPFIEPFVHLPSTGTSSALFRSISSSHCSQTSCDRKYL